MRGLPDFFRLHAIRAQLQDTFIHADVFETERSQTFLTRVTMRLAERGVAKLFQLQIDDRVAAARIGFELAGTRYLYYSSWEGSAEGSDTCACPVRAQISRVTVNLAGQGVCA